MSEYIDRDIKCRKYSKDKPKWNKYYDRSIQKPLPLFDTKDCKSLPLNKKELNIQDNVYVDIHSQAQCDHYEGNWDKFKQICSLNKINYPHDLPDDWPRNASRSDFIIQKAVEKYIKGDLSIAPLPTQSLLAQGNRCVNTKENEELSKLTIPQAVMRAMALGLSLKINKNRGILAFHSTGSGKTLTAASVMDAFWNTEKKIIYLSSVEGIASNPPEIFHNLVQKFFKQFQGINVSKEFKKRGVEFLTFARLVNRLNLLKTGSPEPFLKNSVLIIDEVQNIFKPFDHQRKHHFALRDFLLQNQNQYLDGVNIVILTATPGRTPKEVVELLNIIRDRRYPEIHIPEPNDINFMKSIAGLVSFIDLSRDLSKFPKLIEEPVTKASMSMLQWDKYIKAYKQSIKKEGDFNSLAESDKAHKYLLGARKYCNSLYNYEGKLEEFSCKMPYLIDKLKTFSDDKHFIYSSFYEKRGFGGHGILTISKCLEKFAKYKQVTIDDLKNNKVKKYDYNYVIVSNAFLKEGTESRCKMNANLSQIKDIFNSDANKNGSLIRVIIASNNFNEGLDLKAVNHIHLFEPLVTVEMEKQAIGRAVRQCSHSQYDHKKWSVRVHRYIASKPLNIELDTLTADEIIHTEALERYKVMQTILESMKLAAIDCKITSDFHGIDKCAVDIVDKRVRPVFQSPIKKTSWKPVRKPTPYPHQMSIESYSGKN
jgi:hypothetical protein